MDSNMLDDGRDLEAMVAVVEMCRTSAATSTAVSQAGQSRSATVTATEKRSDELAEGLKGAAYAYGRVAERERAKFENQMPPR
jgi:uncharacterized membrane protein YebE (DUF533 family)